MILTHLGLSAANQRALVTALRHSQTVRVRVGLEDLSGDRLRDITGYLDDGQVTGDNSQPVTRTASAVFHDPHRSLPFDSASPSDTSMDLRRMLRIVWDVWLDATGDFVTIPIFTGPVMEMYRTGEQVTVNCQGKEAFAMGASWSPLHLNKHMKKTDAIRRILKERAGETELGGIPDHPARLPQHRTLVRQSVPWHVARSIAASMDRRLFYDGAGRVRLEPHTSTRRFSFTGEGHVVSPIQVSYNPTTTNAVYVTGAAPKGPKSQITASAVAPANHELSPHQLGRNGVPRFLAQFVTDSSLKTRAEAQARADRVLADGLAQAVQVNFDAIPMPLLDLGDMCHVHTDDGDVTFRLTQFTLPLRVGDGGGLDTAGSPMTVGLVRRPRRLHTKHPGARHQAHRKRGAA